MASQNIVAVPEKRTKDIPGPDKYIKHTHPAYLCDECQPVHIDSGHRVCPARMLGQRYQTLLENAHGKRKVGYPFLAPAACAILDKLGGKYALISGGGSSIGRATTTTFAIKGLRLVISHLPQETEDAKVAADSITIATRIASGAAHMDKFGHLNMLVNDASNIEEKIEHMDLDGVRSTFESIIQMIAVTTFAIPHMMRGSSINTTSGVACAGSPNLVDYSTKGAIVSFTRPLAKQLAPKGIRVNAIAPGPVVTALQPASRDAEDLETFGAGSPLHGRVAQPAELAPTFVFLASPDSNLMTGACTHVNNGMHVGSS